MADTTPSAPPRADNVYHDKKTNRTATYVNGSWLCSCEQHRTMKPGNVSRGAREGRPFLNCPNFKIFGQKQLGCGVFILRDDPEVIAIENRVQARTSGGRQTRQTTLNDFVQRNPRQKNPQQQQQQQANAAGPSRPRPSTPEPASSQPQSSPGQGSSTGGDQYYNHRGSYESSPYPSPTRTKARLSGAPTPTVSRALPSRPAARQGSQDHGHDSPMRGMTGHDDDDYDEEEYNAIRQLEEYFRQDAQPNNSSMFSTPSDPVDDAISDNHGSEYESWDEETKRRVFELTDSFVKSRSKGKRPLVGPLPSQTPPPRARRRANKEDNDLLSPSNSIPRQRLVIAEEERVAKRRKAAIQQAGSEISETSTVPVPTPSRAPPSLSTPRSSRHSAPGEWESSGSESELEPEFEPEPEEAEFVNGVQDRDLESVLTETPSKHTDVANGLPTPITGHIKRFTAAPDSMSLLGRSFADRIAASSSSGCQSQSPPFEDQLAEEVFTTLEKDGLKLPSETRVILEQKFTLYANSVKKIRRDRNQKKEQVHQLKRELEEDQEQYRNLRKQKETAQVGLMELVPRFSGIDKAQAFLEEVESIKVKIMEIRSEMEVVGDD